MLQRILSLFYVGTSFALALFILVQIAHKDDIGALLGAVLLTLFGGTLYVTQRDSGRPRKAPPAKARPVPPPAPVSP